MAMRVAADEAEERRIERKIVKVEFKFEPTLRENCMNLIDVGGVGRSGRARLGRSLVPRVFFRRVLLVRAWVDKWGLVG